MRYPDHGREQVEEAIVRQSLEHPELGADKIGKLVRNHGIRVSNQRVRTLRRSEGLTVPPPRKKLSRRGVSTGRSPQKASYRGHVWTWDFIHDRTVRGGSCRILSIVDEFTRVRIPVKTVHSGRFYSVHLGRSKEGHFQERSNVGVHGVLGGSDSVKRLKSGASFPSVARFSFGSNLLPPRRGVIHRLSPTENGHVPARRRAVSGCG